MWAKKTKVTWFWNIWILSKNAAEPSFRNSSRVSHSSVNKARIPIIWRKLFNSFVVGWEWFNTKRSLTVNTDFKDQIVVVDFFTYCCINCMHILPDLHDLEDKYPSNQSGVVVVSSVFCILIFYTKQIACHMFKRLESIVPNSKMKRFLPISWLLFSAMVSTILLWMIARLFCGINWK